jgi:uncharacterized membrane protein YqjE
MNNDFSEVPQSQESSAGSDSWQEAIPNLIASRAEIFRIEAQDAIQAAIGKWMVIGLALFLIIGAWTLLIAGLIGLVSTQYAWTWYQVAFAAAGGHFLIALVTCMIIKGGRKTESFPITRQEFEKDREWLNQLKNRSNSKN